MGIGNFQHFQQPLHFTVFAADTVQCIETNIGAGGKLRIKLARHINLADLITQRAQRFGAFFT